MQPSQTLKSGEPIPLRVERPFLGAPYAESLAAEPNPKVRGADPPKSPAVALVAADPPKSRAAALVPADPLVKRRELRSLRSPSTDPSNVPL